MRPAGRRVTNKVHDVLAAGKRKGRPPIRRAAGPAPAPHHGPRAGDYIWHLFDKLDDLRPILK
jgi:hypothetical protein